jgi:hypothetical protein
VADGLTGYAGEEALDRVSRRARRLLGALVSGVVVADDGELHTGINLGNLLEVRNPYTYQRWVRRAAWAASSTREPMPSLAKICARCVATVW